MIVPALFITLLLAAPSDPAAPTPPDSLNQPPADAIRSDDGLVMRVEKAGTGTVNPVAADFAKMRVTVWQSDGRLIQHVEEDESVIIQLSNMLPGWRMAVEQMVEGEMRRAWVPASLGAGKIDEGSTFVIDTHLIEILRPHVAPPDVTAPPPTAERSESGLSWIVLAEGDGGDRPGRRSQVTVHYTGWTTDGQLVDSSILRGQPASFPLSGVIAGWREGLQLMTPGEKRRFWIPSQLAYGRDRSKPQGMLVFDVELISFR